MRTRVKYSFINRFVLSVFIIFFSTLNAFAANSLLGVDVKQIDNDNYKIILKVNNAVNIKQFSDSADNLTLVLNSAVPSDSVEILYDNASDLKNVIVQKKNSSNTMILLQGKNIDNAKIYTKELSTGILKQFDSNANSLNKYLYIANKKYILFGLVGIILLFFLMISSRPDLKRNVNKKSKQHNKQTEYNTIRNKTVSQKRYVPSIHYRINNVKTNMTLPKDFVISNLSQYEEEKIRKVG